MSKRMCKIFPNFFKDDKITESRNFNAECRYKRKKDIHE